jgi:4-amino-4-deoxy-L-arabinose transferase-like glycosyltransferase
MKFIRPQSKYIVLLVIIIIAGLLLGQNIDKKFIGHHDWNGVWYGDIARNLLRYNLLTTKLASIKNCDNATPENFRYFTHYPPLFPLILATGISIFGDQESSLRLVIIPFSILLVIFIYKIGNKIFNTQTGLMAAVIAIITPIYIYFGKMPVHEPVILPFILIGVYYYFCWIKSFSRADFLKICFGLGSGMLITWPAYYVPFLLLIHYLLFVKNKKHLPLVLFLQILPFALFFLHLLHTKIITGSFFGGGILQIFFSRINSSSTSNIYYFNFLSFVAKEIRYFINYYTAMLIGLGIIGMLFIGYKLIKTRKYITFGNIGLLFFIGFIYPFFFREAAFLHDYLIYYFLPFMAVSGAAGLYFIIGKFNSKWIKILLFAMCTILIFYERHKFVDALLKSNNSEVGWTIGEFIKNHSQTGDKIFVGSKYYGDFYSPFVCYYSRREANYADSIKENDLNNYKLFIRPKAHDALDLSSKSLLDSKFKKMENTDFIWYIN